MDKYDKKLNDPYSKEYADANDLPYVHRTNWELPE